jgi:NitT/TauT family transport system substrate-binding protein
MKFIIAVALFLTFAGPPLRANAADAQLVVGHTAIKDCVALFVAKEQGYFQQHGLNVTLQPVQNSAVEATAIITNAMTLGCSTPPVLLQALSKGIDLVGIAGATASALTDHSSALVARADADVKTPADLIGKKVGVSGIGSSNYVVLNAWLISQHVDFKRVNYIELPFSTMYDVLKRGTVDAVASVEPIQARILDDKVGSPVVYLLTTMPTDTPIVIYISTGAWAEKNPGLVNAFRAAIADAVKFATAHPDIADQYVAKYLNQPLANVKQAGYSKLDSRLTKKQMRWWVDAMKAQGLIQNEIPGSIVAR